MKRRPVCLVCLALMFLMCAADLAGIPLIRGNPLPESVQAWIEEHPEAVICGEVQSCQDTEFSFSVYLKQVFLINRSEKFPIENVRVFLKTKEDLPSGTLVYASGTLERVEGPRNPGQFDSQQYYACQHIYYFMKNAVIEKKSRSYSGYRQTLLDLKDRFCKILEKAAGEDAPVFEAMLLGEKSDLDNELKLRYQMGGMIHILAISGLHISILGMGLFQTLKFAGLGNTGAGMLSLAVMIQYGMLTGGSVSAMRAVCMFLLSVGAKILGRSYDLPTALALSAILLLMDSPAYLYSSSFLLSFGAVVGLGAVSPYLLEITGAKKKLTKSLLSSFSVQLATLPVMLVFFGEVSVAGILLNLFVLPTVGGVLISGLISCILSLFSLEAAVIAAMPGRALLFLYEQSCILAGKLPFCTWVGGLPEIWQSLIYYGCLILALAAAVRITRKQKKQSKHKFRGKQKTAKGIFHKIKGQTAVMLLFVILAAGILVLSWKDRSGLRITCLDVGQGDGIVLEMPEGGAFLMDCGSSNQKNTGQYQLLPYLKSRGITSLDGIMVSHTDTDHISGIREMLENQKYGIEIAGLVLPPVEYHEEKIKQLARTALNNGTRVSVMEPGDAIASGGKDCLILSCIAPEKDLDVKPGNETSLVLDLAYGNFDMLFTGDAEGTGEDQMAESGRLREYDVLKVAHHGSKNSGTEKFLNLTRPSFAVISAGIDNRYGHPHADTVRRLTDAGCTVCSTQDNGAVTIESNGETMKLYGFTETLVKQGSLPL